MGRHRTGGGGGVGTVLSSRMEAFCQAYVVCDNGTQAVVKAGYKCASVGSTSASVQANDLLKLPKIQARIASLRDQIALKSGIDAAEIMQIQAEIARDSRSETNRLRACAQLAQMIPGALAPTKIDQRVLGRVQIEVVREEEAKKAISPRREPEAIEGEVADGKTE